MVKDDLKYHEILYAGGHIQIFKSHTSPRLVRHQVGPTSPFAQTCFWGWTQVTSFFFFVVVVGARPNQTGSTPKTHESSGARIQNPLQTNTKNLNQYSLTRISNCDFENHGWSTHGHRVIKPHQIPTRKTLILHLKPYRLLHSVFLKRKFWVCHYYSPKPGEHHMSHNINGPYHKTMDHPTHGNWD